MEGYECRREKREREDRALCLARRERCDGGKEGAESEEIDVCGRAARYSPSKTPSSTRTQASHREVKVRKVNPVTRVPLRARTLWTRETETTRIPQDHGSKTSLYQGLQVDTWHVFFTHTTSKKKISSILSLISILLIISNPHQTPIL